MKENLLEPLVEAGKDVGGLAGVEAVLTMFYKKMAQDMMLGFFFSGKNLQSIIRQQKSFLARAMGLQKTYEGKSPREAHRPLPPILKGHFDRRLILLRETLTEFGLPAKSIEAWIDFEDAFRQGIVEEEGALSKRKR